MPAFYYFITALAKTLFTLLTRWHVQGRERVPQQGSLIVVANHLNNADPAVLGASIPRLIVFMAKEELFDSWLKSLLIRGYCAFPVRKGRVDRVALTRAGAVLRQGQVLGMFPEGTRSDSQAQLQPAFRGAALLARRYQAPILPVGISGTERLNGFGWVFTRPRVTVEIGEPFM
ncbi:MAG: lysophospholipid acyltransferase family protein, partial [Dehalococcoidia bacterium]